MKWRSAIWNLTFLICFFRVATWPNCVAVCLGQSSLSAPWSDSPRRCSTPSNPSMIRDSCTATLNPPTSPWVVSPRTPAPSISSTLASPANTPIQKAKFGPPDLLPAFEALCAMPLATPTQIVNSDGTTTSGRCFICSWSLSRANYPGAGSRIKNR